MQQKQWLIHDLIPRDGLMILGGASQVGKTFLALEMAACIAAVRPFLGLEARLDAVIYVAGGGSVEGLVRRPAALRERFDRAGVLGSAVLRFAPERLSLTDNGGKTATERLACEADVLLERFGRPCGLVVVDTVASMSAGEDENSPAGMG